MGFLGELRSVAPGAAASLAAELRRRWQAAGDAELGELAVFNLESEERCERIARHWGPHLADWMRDPFEENTFAKLRLNGPPAAIGGRLVRMMSLDAFVDFHLLDKRGKRTGSIGRERREALDGFRSSPNLAVLVNEVRGGDAVTFASPEREFTATVAGGADAARDVMGLGGLPGHSSDLPVDVVLLKYQTPPAVYVPTVIDAHYQPWFGPTHAHETSGFARDLEDDEARLPEVVHAPIAAADIEEVDLDFGVIHRLCPRGWRDERTRLWTAYGHVRAR